MSKTVTVFNTRGSNRTVINDIDAKVLEELHEIFDANGIQWRGMTLVEGESQTTLESLQAKLPDRDFTVFCFPKKVNSGTGDAGQQDTAVGETHEDTDPVTLEIMQARVEDCQRLLNRTIAAYRRSLPTEVAGSLEMVADGLGRLHTDVTRFADYMSSPETYELRKKAGQIAENLV